MLADVRGGSFEDGDCKLDAEGNEDWICADPTGIPQLKIAGMLAASVLVPMPIYGSNDVAGNFVVGRIDYAQTE